MYNRVFIIIFAIQLAGRSVFAADIPQSAAVLTFGENNTLFVADAKGAAVFAYRVTAHPNDNMQQPYNLTGFDRKVAVLLKAPVENLFARGFAIDPVNKDAYISFDVIRDGHYVPVIIVTGQAGALRTLDLANTPHTSTKIKDPNLQEFKLWSDVSLRSMTITDMKFFKGRLYVCGLSNADFSSTLRVIDYPFNGSNSSSSIEIYHTVHDQMETRAPMRNLEFVNADGKDYLVGSYTCTPFVAIPLDELKDGAHVTGKTLAEMAVGNTPIDLFSYTAQDWNKQQYPVLLLTNKHHAAELIRVDDIISAIRKQGMIKPVGLSGVDKAGMPSQDIPQLTGLIHAADQDPFHIVALHRNSETGTLDLYSYLKGAWLRLDEFESEFAFPSYRYRPAKEQIKQFQGMDLKDIGQPQKFKPVDN